MPARFRLSNRQRKELDRGAMLRIALPAPVHEPPDLRRWVRDSLPDVPPTWLRDISEREIVVRPGDGTLGTILKEEQLESLPEDWLVLCVAVVVVEVSQLPEPRSRYPIQWGEHIKMPKEEPSE